MRRLFLPLLGLALTVLAAAFTEPVPAAQKDAPDKPDDEPVLPERIGKLTLTLDPGGHTAHIKKVFFTPDGKQLITISWDGSVRFWDVDTGQTVKVLYPPGFRGAHALAAALSLDGKRLAVASRYPDGEKFRHVIHVLALPEGRIEHVLRGHNTEIGALAFAPDGKRLASGGFGSNSTTRIWNLAKSEPGEIIRPIGASGLAFSPDGTRLALAGGKGRCQIIDLASNKEVASIDGSHVAWSPDGKSLATLGSGGGVRLWDADGTLRIHKMDGVGVSSVVFGGDSRIVLATRGGTKGGPTLLDVATGKELMMFKPKGIPGYLARGGALSPDGQLAATVALGVGSGTHLAFVWKTKDGALHKQLAAPSWIGGGSTRAAWSADSKVVSWSSDPKKPSFHLDELRFGPPLADKEAHGVILKQGDLSLERDPNNNQPNVLKAGTLVAKPRVPNAGLATLVGKGWVALAGADGVFRLFDAISGKAVRGFKGHFGLILGIAPSPDGRLLMSVSNDQTLRIWNPEREKPLLSLYVNGQDWVIWTPEGYYAATPGGERLIGWTVDNGIDQMPSFYPVERFRKQLYRPDLIKKAFELGSVEAALKALDGAKAKPVDLEKLLPPKCALEILEQKGGVVKLKVSAQAATPTQPVTALRLLVDGRPLPNQEGYLAFQTGQSKAEREWTITVPAGEHQLAVLARSPDASSISSLVPVKNVDPAKLPVMHVLAIGIDGYQDPALKLDFAAADAKAITDAFQKGCKGPLFQDVKGTPLVNQQATRAAVLQAMAELRKQVKPNDLVVVFFAGHGVKDREKFYLLTAEADTKNLARTALSGEELRKALGEFPCQVLLMLDACHAAAGVKAFKPATDDLARALTDDEVGVAVMCAAMGHEKAIERKGNGLFTKAVVEAVTAPQGVPCHPSSRRQYLHHLHSHIFDRVSEESGDKQHPFLSLPWVVESFALRQLPVKSPGER